MRIESFINWVGKDYPVQYEDMESFDGINDFTQIYGVCYVDDKVAICYNRTLGYWVLPGGRPEAGETVEQALRREIMEEAGLKLVKYKPIGGQRVVGDGKVRYQLRAVCKCEKVAEVNDPCGDISEMRLINISEIGEYIDWGKVGRHVFKRAETLVKDL